MEEKIRISSDWLASTLIICQNNKGKLDTYKEKLFTKRDESIKTYKAMSDKKK